jgi:hypothetical protein
MGSRGSKVSRKVISAVIVVGGIGCGGAAEEAAPTAAAPTTPIVAGSAAPVAPAPTGTAGAPATSTGAAAPAPTAGVQPPAATPPVAAVPPVTTPAGTPGAGTTPAAGTPGAGTTPAGTPGTTTPATGTDKPKLAMGECGLKTQYPGDEYCINPPPADKGFQMHIGPSNYDNPEPQYILQPGEEVTENFNATSGNDKDVYFYWRQYRMRPGSHHLIINAGTRRLGGSSNLAKDNPEAGVIAPENMGVGMPLSARTPLSNSLHYFNFGDKPIIKEVWVNFWYRDQKDVTEPTHEIFSMLGMGIAPGQRVVKHGSCAITAPGRVLTAYGHVHAHNKRFSVYRKRGSDNMLVHEAYDWEHPNISEYSSTVTNPTLDHAAKKDGGFSGILDVKSGDSIEFECDILNDTNFTFLGQNEAENDEMCILIGDTVETTVPPFCTSADLPASE